MVNSTLSPNISFIGNLTTGLTKTSPQLINTKTCGEFQYNFHEDIPLSVVFGLCFIIGLFMIFTGYRLFRFSLFFQVFSLIAVIVYLVLTWFLNLTTLYNGLAAAGGGIAIGLAAMFIKTLGLFGISLIQGVFLATCILYIINVLIVLRNVFVSPGLVLICFVILVLPLIRWERFTSILYTSSYGTILVMLSIDYYLNLSMLRKIAYENLLSFPRVTKPCWFSWILFGLWPVLVILGCLVQLLKTGKNYDHKEDKYCCKKDKQPAVHLLSDKNDVIAKAWIQAPSTPSEKGDYYSPINYDAGSEEIFLMQELTPV